MTRGTLDELTAFFTDPIPEEYLNVLRDYPSELLGISRSEGEGGLEGLVEQLELLIDPADVLELNYEVRGEPILSPENEEFDWPDSLIVIGENGIGDYFCLDITGEHSGVMQFDHQETDFFVVADSVADYVQMLRETFAAEP